MIGTPVDPRTPAAVVDGKIGLTYQLTETGPDMIADDLLSTNGA
jgi:hypothetical protein